MNPEEPTTRSLASLPLFADDPDPAVDVLPRSATSAPTLTPLTHLAGTSPTSQPGALTQRAGNSRSLAPGAGSMSTDAWVHRANLDWSRVAAFRALASDHLTTAVKGRDITKDAQRELGRSIIFDLLDAAAQHDQLSGHSAWSMTDQQAMAEAVFDAVFGLGRFQPLVDAEDIENIEVLGCEPALLEDSNGTLREGPPVAESDSELTDFLSFLGTRSEVNARPFSESQPRLHLRLDGGARLAAMAWVTPRPYVVIRRHRLREVTLEDLVNRGTLTPTLASFLHASVRAKKSIVVSGDQGAGKTTLVRALCAALDPWERIGTFETEYELHLHELPAKHRRVVACEARPGSGERGIDGRQAGEITLDDLLTDSFRMNLSRQIVGEVRGREVMAMFKAMASGAGSISTTHAAHAVGAISKLVTCALEAGQHVTVAYANALISQHIDLVVHVTLETQPTLEGPSQRTRYVSEVIAIHPGEEGAPAATHVFRPSPLGPATPHVLPDELRALARHGFDLDAYNRERESGQ